MGVLPGGGVVCQAMSLPPIQKRLRDLFVEVAGVQPGRAFAVSDVDVPVITHASKKLPKNTSVLLE